jgi:hypothetical protein
MYRQNWFLLNFLLLGHLKIYILISAQDYDSYTEVEVHAELVFAECLLLKVKFNFLKELKSNSGN